MKSNWRGKRIVRLHALLAALILVSTALLVLNVVDRVGSAGDSRMHDGMPDRQIMTVGAMHALTVLAAVAVWFSLRQRARDLRRLWRSEQRHRSIINHAGEAIFLLDGGGIVREWNKAAERFFGASRRTVLGCPLCDVHLCYGLEIDRAIEDSQRLQRSLTLEFPWRRAQRPDGLIKLTVSPLPPGRGTDDPQERLFVVIARDVTSERQLESRMSQAEKLAGIGQLAAGIAHQLNTPLGAILLSAQMLAETDLPEDQAEDVERIIRQTEQCRQIIKGLLNFARPQSRERTRLQLGDVVQETVYLIEKNLRAAGVTVAIEQTGPVEIVGNRNELDQVFFNLLVNAVDAMPSGGVVTIALGPGDPGEVQVSFADTGTGIPAGQRDRIFLPFFTTKDYGKGTGLGLSIVARIVHEHGGRIELDEDHRDGARFLLAFPLPGLGLEAASAAPSAQERP
jgi:two-component system, NtrC family, sensor kinase